MTAPIVFHNEARDQPTRQELFEMGWFCARTKQRHDRHPPVPGQLWDRLAER